MFFSGPLDLDLMMLEAFPTEYQALAPGEQGPALVTSPDDRENVLKAVLGSAGAGGYTKAQEALFPWYRYRFLSKHKGKGKPAAHLNALSRISPERLRGECPEVLKRLVARVQNLAAALTE